MRNSIGKRSRSDRTTPVSMRPTLSWHACALGVAVWLASGVGEVVGASNSLAVWFAVRLAVRLAARVCSGSGVEVALGVGKRVAATLSPCGVLIAELSGWELQAAKLIASPSISMIKTILASRSAARAVGAGFNLIAFRWV